MERSRPVFSDKESKSILEMSSFFLGLHFSPVAKVKRVSVFVEIKAIFVSATSHLLPK